MPNRSKQAALALASAGIDQSNRRARLYGRISSISSIRSNGCCGSKGDLRHPSDLGLECSGEPTFSPEGRLHFNDRIGGRGVGRDRQQRQADRCSKGGAAVIPRRLCDLCLK